MVSLLVEKNYFFVNYELNFCSYLSLCELVELPEHLYKLNRLLCLPVQPVNLNSPALYYALRIIRRGIFNM